MKRLKRALATILLVCVVLNIACAATFKDYSYISQEYRQDVEVLIDKKIISGYPDGTFRPKNKITRAEFSKMIFGFINCNSNINLSSYEKGHSEYTDVEGKNELNWAKVYINYCTDKGIISGVGNSKFNPKGNITIVEASKMLLVALGYDPLIEGFLGSDWKENITAKAKEIGLYKGFSVNMSQAATREQVCKLINNAFSTDAYNKKDIYAKTADGKIKVNDIRKFCKALEGCWVNLSTAKLQYGRYEYFYFKDCTMSYVVVPSEWPPAGKIVEVYKDKNDREGDYILKLSYEATRSLDGQYVPGYTKEFKFFFSGSEIVKGSSASHFYTYICKDYTEIPSKLQDNVQWYQK